MSIQTPKVPSDKVKKHVSFGYVLLTNSNDTDPTTYSLRNSDDLESQAPGQGTVIVGQSSKSKIKVWVENHKSLVTTLAELLLVSIFSIAYSFVFINPLCDLMFQCGCTWPWSGGHDFCTAGDPDTSPCPSCSASFLLTLIPKWGGMIVMAFTAMVVRFLWLRAYSKTNKNYLSSLTFARWLSMLMAAVVVFYVVNVTNGWISKEATNYPHFLWN